jgi:hypothetical protein
VTKAKALASYVQVKSALGDLLLRGLYAFYTEHERCGELEGGVEREWVFNLLALHLD